MHVSAHPAQAKAKAKAKSGLGLCNLATRAYYGGTVFYQGRSQGQIQGEFIFYHVSINMYSLEDIKLIAIFCFLRGGRSKGAYPNMSPSISKKFPLCYCTTHAMP